MRKPMPSRIIPSLLLLLALLAVGCGDGTPREYAKLYRVTEPNRYLVSYLYDPFVSFSPDSKTMVFYGVTRGVNKADVYTWNIGDAKTRKLFFGFTPNYISGDEIIYVHPYTGRKCIQTYNFKTGEVKEVCPKLKESDYWKEIFGIESRGDGTFTTRMCDFSKYYFAGSDICDIEGNILGPVKRIYNDTSVAVYDISGDRAVTIRSTDNDNVLNLVVSGKDGETDKKVIGHGKFGDAAWRPGGGSTLAVADGASVLLWDADSGEKKVIADIPKGDRSFVCRLKWSPDGKYLAIGVFVDEKEADYMDIYVAEINRSAERG
ncbi:MAG: WD40 repeat domain-containing protein [Abditibacteriota bacterium]|nr:WD40 repeat domain-containing protein [Abditibacteriota bacterium]